MARRRAIVVAHASGLPGPAWMRCELNQISNMTSCAVSSAAPASACVLRTVLLTTASSGSCHDRNHVKSEPVCSHCSTSCCLVAHVCMMVVRNRAAPGWMHVTRSLRPASDSLRNRVTPIACCLCLHRVLTSRESHGERLNKQVDLTAENLARAEAVLAEARRLLRLRNRRRTDLGGQSDLGDDG